MVSPGPGGAVLTLRAAGERVTLPVDRIAEILRPRALTRVPLAPPSLLGVTNLRGTVLPVLCLGALMGGSGTTSAGARIVVVDGLGPVGLLVDQVLALGQVDDARPLDMDALLAAFGTPARRSGSGSGPGGAAPDRSRGTATEPDRLVLLGFRLGAQDYALPLDRIVAVAPLPDRMTRLPDTDPALIGVAETRGHLLPLVSPHVLLGLPGQETAAEGTAIDGRRSMRVVVTRLGTAQVGLVVDNITAIFRVAPELVDPVPPILARGRTEARIDAICRLEHGRRLLSVLSPQRLFDDDTVRRITAGVTQETRGMTESTGTGADPETSRQFVLFRLGPEQYGLPIAAVDEVLRHPGTLTRVPYAPPFLEGVMNLRGKVLPVIDQRQRFAVAGEAPPQRRIVVVTLGTLQAGFAVDSASQVLSLPETAIVPAPVLTEEEAPLFDRVATAGTNGPMILLVDPAALLDRAARDVLEAIVARNRASGFAPDLMPAGAAPAS